MKLICILLSLTLTACGGGGDPVAPTVVPQLIIAFYGDSITEGRPVDIAQGDFKVQDFAKAAKTSDAPLDPSDISTITVIRYGMADTVKGVAPEATRRNIQSLIAQVTSLGRTPIVVNVNRTESGLEKPTNQAIADLVDIDVSNVQGATVDGVHPSEPFHVALNKKIHDDLIVYIQRSNR